MFLFVITALIITIIVVFFMVKPLLTKASADQALERHQQNIHFARDRLQELEQQFEAEQISEQEYQSLKLELEAILAEDMTDTEIESEQANSTSNAVLITLLCCLIPFSGLALYLLTGKPMAINNTVAATLPEQNNTASSTPSSMPQQGIEQMVKSLEERLQNQPNDIKGWTILSRTYQQLGRFQDAIRALEHLNTIQPNNPETYAQLADANAFINGGKLSGKPQKYISQALQLDPLQPQALWLAGLSAVQIGDNNKAIEYWEKLAPLLTSSPDQQQQLLDIIAETKAEANTSSSKPNQLATNTTQNSEVSPNNVAAAPAGLKVSVSIDPSISANINANDTVFVIAKSKNGPPAPLAVRKLRAGDLPANLILSDRDAMMSAQFKISLFPEIVLTARVAKSGSPMASSGDYQSKLIDTSNKSTAVHNLNISELIQ